MDNRTQYVVGFLFKITKDFFFLDHYEVALLEKNRPEWQKGKFNGIGGHIENGETPLQAMKREFNEEAGVLLDSWEQYCTIYYTDAIIHFFRCFDGDGEINTKTDEKVFWQPLEELGNNVIPNLHWLIPLALYTDTDMQQVLWCKTDKSIKPSSSYLKKED
jgi:8-oxo-dGTP diphosphatase